MSVPKLSTMVMLLLLANLLMVAVSSVDPLNPSDTGDGALQRIGHIHLKGLGSDKATLAVRGDSLGISRFADQEGTWHACADDVHSLTPPARISCDNDDDDEYSSVISGQVRLKDLRVGTYPTVDAMVDLARSTAKTLDDGWNILSRILEQGHEPADVWKTMSCAVLIAEQNGGAWRSKEAAQLRSLGLFSKEDVLKQLGVIAWPNDCSEPITLDRDSL